MFIKLHYKKVEGNPAFVVNTDYLVVVATIDDNTTAISVRFGNVVNIIKVVESYEEIASLLSGI